MIGVNAGHKITTGGGNICIGYGAGPQTAGAGNDNRLYIDARVTLMEKGQVHLFMVTKAVVIKTLHSMPMLSYLMRLQIQMDI